MESVVYVVINERGRVILLLTKADKTTIMLGSSATNDGLGSSATEFSPHCLQILKKAFLAANGKGGGSETRAQGVIPSDSLKTAVDVIIDELNIL